MMLRGLTISVEHLLRIQDRQFEDSTLERGRAQRVTDMVLSATAQKYAACSCEDHGLHSGMTVQSLIEIDGCKVAFACPRLDAVRRHYGI